MEFINLIRIFMENDMSENKKMINVSYPNFNVNEINPYQDEMEKLLDISLTEASTTRTIKNITECLTKSLRSKYGISPLPMPREIAFLSSPVRMSFMTSLMRPPLYKKVAKPSDNTLIADEEKNPNIRSKRVELQRQSEKKPAGSHSGRDLYLRCLGHLISAFSISN